MICTRPAQLFLLILAMSLPIGWQRDVHAAPPAAAEHGAARQPSGTPRSATVRPQSKPIPPIDIRYEIIGQPGVGRPVELRITTRSSVELLDVRVDVQGAEFVSVVPRAGNRNVPRVPADEALIRTVTLVPLVDGALHVGVLVQAEINGRALSRSIMIPLDTGAATAESAPDYQLAVDEFGDPIVLLPAQ